MKRSPELVTVQVFAFRSLEARQEQDQATRNSPNSLSFSPKTTPLYLKGAQWFWIPKALMLSGSSSVRGLGYFERLEAAPLLE